jgi:hypothetical protein
MGSNEHCMREISSYVHFSKHKKFADCIVPTGPVEADRIVRTNRTNDMEG